LIIHSFLAEHATDESLLLLLILVAALHASKWVDAHQVVLGLLLGLDHHLGGHGAHCLPGDLVVGGVVGAHR